MFYPSESLSSVRLLPLHPCRSHCRCRVWALHSCLLGTVVDWRLSGFGLFCRFFSACFTWLKFVVITVLTFSLTVFPPPVWIFLEELGLTHIVEGLKRMGAETTFWLRGETWVKVEIPRIMQRQTDIQRQTGCARTRTCTRLRPSSCARGLGGIKILNQPTEFEK